jgi:hypothetical protein
MAETKVPEFIVDDLLKVFDRFLFPDRPQNDTVGHAFSLLEQLWATTCP